MINPEKDFLDQAKITFFSYDQWREKFLNTVLWFMSALGIGLVVANVPSATSLELVIFVILAISLLAATMLPIPYTIKAGTMIAVGYFVGLYNVIGSGPWADGTVFFLAVSIFTSLLFDGRSDWYMFALNVLSLVVMSILDLTGVFHITQAGLPPAKFGLWLTYSADYIALAIASIWAINLLKAEFKTISEQFRSALFFVTKDRTELERRVDERTIGLVRKTDQLRAASYIAHQTAESQDMESIITNVVNLVTEQFGFYHTGLFLMNETGDEVVLQAASSEGGKLMLERGYSAKVDAHGSLVGMVAAQKKPRIALDVGADAVSFNNTDLPMTRSEVAIPLLVHNRVLGVLDIQSDQQQAFKVDDIDVLQTLTDQVAVAIENARLLDEAQSALLQIEALTTVRTREAWNQKIQKGNYTYTYTPLGLRAGKESEDGEKALNVPIVLKGQKIGTISLSRKGNNTSWTGLDQDLVNEVAYQTGLAIDNIRLVEDATQRAKQEQTVGELATRFSQSLDIDSLLQTAARELGQVTDVSEVSIFIGQIPEQATQKKRAKRTAS
ncbi:MAG: GAF domain-containing protein [Anaerolineales bacterium]|nr:GAF domain-containing protein [Anaerolineales bacterium]